MSYTQQIAQINHASSNKHLVLDIWEMKAKPIEHALCLKNSPFTFLSQVETTPQLTFI